MNHVSDLTKISNCPRMAWLTRYDKAPNISYPNSPVSFSQQWMDYLDAKDWPLGIAWDSSETSLSHLEKEGKGVRLRFEAKGLRTSISAMIKETKEEGNVKKEGYHLYYPYRSCKPKANHAEHMAMDLWILEQLNIPVAEISILYINDAYEIGKDRPLLKEGKHFLKGRGTPEEKTVLEQAKEVLAGLDMEALIEQAEKILTDEEMPQPVRCKSCSHPRKCSWYESCFQEEEELPDNSILHLVSSSARFDMQEKGTRRLADADPALLEGIALQNAQILADRKGGQFVDLVGLKAFFNQLVYPLIYLDFEWDTYLIPPYKNMRPFDVLCFQYSMHIESKEGKIRHVNFFGEGDSRVAFIESLLKRVPESGSIVVYNMEGGEKLRLMQLARQFPRYARQLTALTERMVDLNEPFERGLFYDIHQKGRTSLKQILPLFTDRDGYKDLDQVANGLDAIMAWRKIESGSDPKEKDELARAISDYCAMDTLAEIDVLHGLEKLVKQKEEEYAKYYHPHPLCG